MSEPMSDERLAELQRERSDIRWSQKHHPRMYNGKLSDARRLDTLLADAVDEIDRLRAGLAATKAEKNGAYAERNKVVAALAKLFPSGVLRDTDEDGWWIVFIDLPDGQASWHFHESELDLLISVPKYEGQWDGHSPEEKYARLEALLPRYFQFPGSVIEGKS